MARRRRSRSRRKASRGAKARRKKFTAKGSGPMRIGYRL